MGWARSSTVRDSLGENRSLEWTVELDERTLELADDIFAIPLRPVEDEKRLGKGIQKPTKYVSGFSCSCIRTVISSSCVWPEEVHLP